MSPRPACVTGREDHLDRPTGDPVARLARRRSFFPTSRRCSATMRGRFSRCSRSAWSPSGPPADTSVKRALAPPRVGSCRRADRPLHRRSAYPVHIAVVEGEGLCETRARARAPETSSAWLARQPGGCSSSWPQLLDLGRSSGSGPGAARQRSAPAGDEGEAGLRQGRVSRRLDLPELGSVSFSGQREARPPAADRLEGGAPDILALEPRSVVAREDAGRRQACRFTSSWYSSILG